MGVILELLGAPGSGKSSVRPLIEAHAERVGLHPIGAEDLPRHVAARTAMGRLVTRLVPASQRSRALWATYRVAGWWHTARFALANRRLSRHVIVSQRSRPAESLRGDRRVTYWFARHMGLHRMCATHLEDDELVVFDEGFSHRTVQLHAGPTESVDAPTVEAYVGMIPTVGVVHVATSADVCVRRVHGRGVWDRLADLPTDEVDAFVRNAHATSALTGTALREAERALVEIDNDTDVDTLVLDDRTLLELTVLMGRGCRG
ncbi:MAG: hypothetical protein AAF480_07875 [Actinomycetota bacterium]